MRKLTNKELARKAGYSEAHISRVLRGHVLPSIKCVLRMSAVLKIGVNEMLVRIKEKRWD